jgi:hypothetical protein
VIPPNPLPLGIAKSAATLLISFMGVYACPLASAQSNDASRKSMDFCEVADAMELAERVHLRDDRRIGVRLLTNRQEVEAGELMIARLVNFSADFVRSGAEFRIQRFDGIAWHADPSSPAGPWPRSAQRLKPDGVAGCYRYVAPEGQPAGRYRFLTSIDRITEQYSKRYYKAVEFFIREHSE